jgi:hypothetical protein
MSPNTDISQVYKIALGSISDLLWQGLKDVFLFQVSPWAT